ncbi:outer membrane beta-barrel protein [Flavobacterium psychrotrophum]|uniref:outer membrane beta-barrel protein n=1 Tax=Flavobacterium psychrotrophum TaxID=2294119 RepID=UPI000E324782|nr:outer membrane beta-barrel protein [Flavobacterium psychrotrophum]
MYKFFVVFFLIFCAPAYSQSITLKGTVQDPDGTPLENTTVYLRTVKDSVMLGYAISDQKGEWQIKTRNASQPAYLKVSYMGFETYQKPLDSIKRDIDFGIIKLKEAATELNEVIIESETPPIRIKKDTLEFNAGSFKTRPDANVKELLKKLPGFDIDPSTGKLTVNGKDVPQILVNGKPFFDENGTMALENLPAELISKIQVSDYKTKKEELSGQKASGNMTTINLTIDKNKNKGFFGNASAGYGTNDRYQANAMLNYFNNQRRISVVGSSNNINAISSLGMGMRTGSMFSLGGIGSGSSGRTVTNSLGVNYSDEWFKDFSPNISYNYSGSESRNDNKSRTETFLINEDGTATENSQINNSTSSSRSVSDSQNINGSFDIKIDSTARMYIKPSFNRSNNKSTGNTAQTVTDQDGNLLNESSNKSLNDSDRSVISNTINFNKAFKHKKGRFISASFSNLNSITSANNYANSLTTFYEDTDENGIPVINNVRRNQLQKNSSSADEYNAEISFTEPINDSLQAGVGLAFEHNSESDNSRGFYYNETNGAFTTVADSITKYTGNTTTRINPFTEITLNKNKLNFRTTLGTNFYTFNNYGSYLGNDFALTTRYALPTLTSTLRYEISKGKSLTVNYNFSTNLPSSSQLLPVVDVTDPLITTTGNKNLDPGKSHRMSVNFHRFNFTSQSGLFIFGTASINERQIVNYTELTSSGKTNITYRNMAGGYSASLSSNYNKNVKMPSGNNIRYSLSLTGNFSHDLGFTNTKRYSAERLMLSSNINVNYDIGEVLSINPSYNYSITNADYTNYARGSASTFSHRAGLGIVNYWPKHIVMENNMSYNYNSQLSAGYRKDSFLWNSSLGYNFFKDKLLFKVTVYDLLNQNIGTSRSITATGVTDSQNTVLNRYMIFSLTWKIKNFSGSKPRGAAPSRIK